MIDHFELSAAQAAGDFLDPRATLGSRDFVEFVPFISRADFENPPTLRHQPTARADADLAFVPAFGAQC